MGMVNEEQSDWVFFFVDCNVPVLHGPDTIVPQAAP